MAQPDSSQRAALDASVPPPDAAGADGAYQVLTPERVGLQYDVAGIGSRSLAAGIDSVIQAVLAIIATLAAFLLVMLAGLLGQLSRLGSLIDNEGEPTRALWIVLAVWVVIIFGITTGYFVLFEALWNGQTPGKRLLHLRVIRENGYPIRAVDAVIRNLVRIVDALPTGYAIGLATMLLNNRAKRVGDFAAGTIVVREGDRQVATLSQALAAAGAPAVATARAGPRLSAEHATLVRDFLSRREAMARDARQRLAARLAGVLAERYGLQSQRAGQQDERFLESVMGDA